MVELQLNKDNFEKEVLQSDLPVLVDFYATWCPPCKMLAPVIEQLAEELRDKMKVAKLDIDQNQAIAQKYGVMSVPTMIIFESGKEKKRMVGLRSKEDLVKELT